MERKNLLGVAGAIAILIGTPGGASAQNSPAPDATNPATPATPTSPQPASDREAIARLTKELEEARAEIAALRARIAELEGRAPNDESHAARPAIPIDPLSCPASMLVELKRRYERELGAFPVATASQRQRLMDEAPRWCRAVARDLRGKRVWLAKIEDVKPGEPGDPEAFVAKVTALDDVSHRPLGDSVRVGLSARLAERVRSVERERRVGDPDADPATLRPWAWELTAIVAAAPVFDRERSEPGVFNAPAFVGVYVGFGMELEVVGLSDVDLPAEKKPEDRPAKPPSLDPGR